MSKITIEVPKGLEKEIPKDKEELTRIFLMGLNCEKASKALLQLKKLKGCMKKAYPDTTSVELQHKGYGIN